MSYAILAAVLILLVGVIACLILWSMFVAERAKLAPLQAALATAQKARSDSVLEEAAAKSRLEEVITGLKKEIATLENDLASCRDPGSIRDRLRGLLGGVQSPLPVPSKPDGGGGPVPP